MLKILVFSLLLIVLAACGRTTPHVSEYPNYSYATANGHYEEDAAEDYAFAVPSMAIMPHIPLEYIVMLDVDPETRIVQGISRVNFTNRTGQPLDTIVLRVFLNAFQEDVQPRPYSGGLIWRMHRPGEGRGHMDIESVLLNNETAEYKLDNTILTIYLPEPLAPEAAVQLILQYSAYVPKLGHRIGGNDAGMWFSMFLPVLAVHGEDGWHIDNFYPIGDPFFLEAANYSVTITTPLSHKVVGTGHRTEEVIEDTDTRITRLAASMVRDFAFAVLSQEYNLASTTTDSGIEINLFYHAPIVGARVDYVLKQARITMEHFERTVGIYPFGQVNILEVDLLYDSIASSQMIFVDTSHLARGNLESMTHSIGSLWFASIVGTNRIAEPWLDKGITRLVAAGIFHDTPEDLNDFISREHAIIADRTDLFISDGLWAYTRRDNFVNAQGRKPMLMLHRLQLHMGEEDFWTFVSNYYQAHSFQVATADDFIRTAEEVYGSSLRAFFNVWITRGTIPPLEMMLEVQP